MQDNPFNEAFLNEAWDDMRLQLDQAMPVEKRQRLLVWWWLSGAAIMALLAFVLRIGEGPNVISPVLNIEQAQATVIMDHTPTEIQAALTEKTTVEQELSTHQYTDQNEPGSLSPKPVNENLSAATQKIGDPIPQVTNVKRNFFEVAELPGIIVLANHQDSLILNFTPPVFSSKVENKINSSLLAYAEGNYEARLGDINSTIGLGWQIPLGRFRLGLAPGIQWGCSSIDIKPQNNEFALEAEQDNSTPGTAFQPNATNADPQDIDFRFTNFRLPFYLGYQLSKKWTIGTGVIWNNILNFSALDQTDSQVYRSFQQYNTNSAGAKGESRSFDDLLQRRSFGQVQLGMTYQLADHWQLYGAYQQSFTKVLESESLRWNRNYATIGLRYEINSYIFGKK
ncbi:MAG TPA: hypothetical protein VJ953_11910 [Saprospiraceae bacterium]|nr:hypothetical protein [Saprospiraceae bacterium]